MESTQEWLQSGCMVYYNLENGETDISDEIDGKSQVVRDTEGEVVSVEHLSYRAGDLLTMTDNERGKIVLVVCLGSGGIREHALAEARGYLSRLVKWHGPAQEGSCALDVMQMATQTQIPELFEGLFDNDKSPTEPSEANDAGDSNETWYSEAENDSS